MNDRCAYELAIDDGHERNTSLVVDFARSQGIPVHVGRGERQPGCLDLGNADLPRLLQSGRWDVVEAVCFANAATNQAVLDSLGDTPLVYTPHDQPLWTVPMAADEAAQTAAVHQRMTARADLILCDSRFERKTVQQLAPSRSSAVHLPLGCDFDQFAPGGWPRAEQLLFVGDLVEPRKRFDRALAAFAHVKPRWPGLKLVVVGNRSQDATGMIPPTLRPSVETSRLHRRARPTRRLRGLSGIPPPLRLRGLRHPDSGSPRLGHPRLHHRPGRDPRPVQPLRRGATSAQPTTRSPAAASSTRA